jgi:predicted MFS family arabinose efflux permease
MSSEQIARPQTDWPKASSAWFGVTILTLAYAIAYTDRLILSLLIEPIKMELGLSDTKMSIIVGASFALFYSTMALPIARYADRGNRKNLLLICAVLWSVMTALCGLAVGFWTLFLARVGVAIGEACIGPTSLSIISDSFQSEKRSRPIGVWFTGAALGAVATFVGGAALLAPDGPAGFLHNWLGGTMAPWRVALIALGLLGLPLILLLLMLREPSRKERVSDQQMPLKDVLAFIGAHKPMLFSLFAGSALIQLTFDGVFLWLTPFLQRVHDLEPAAAGPYIGLISLIAGPLGTIGSSYLYDAFRRRGHVDAAMRSILLLTAIALAGISFAPLAGSLLLALLGFAIFIAALAGATTLPQMGLQVTLPNELRAQITAFYFFTVNVFGFGVGPLVTALLTDYVFQGEQLLGYSMTALSFVILPIAFLIIARGLSAFRTSNFILTKVRTA